jgi:hypothetical protein
MDYVGAAAELKFIPACNCPSNPTNIRKVKKE